MKKALIVFGIFGTGIVSGILFATSLAASADDHQIQPNPSDVTFLVSIDEVAQNFVFGDQFSGEFVKTVTMSDGSERSIVLTPMEKDGQLWVRFQDGQGHTFMGPNGSTYNGNLLVNLRNHDQISRSHN